MNLNAVSVIFRAPLKLLFGSAKLSPIGHVSCRNLWNRANKSSFGRYSVVQPGYVTPGREVPPHIIRPVYHNIELSQQEYGKPEIKTREMIDKLRDSCKLAKEILKAVENFVTVGITTDEVDNLVHTLAIENNAYPSPLHYRGFPKSVCTSVNNVACHGIPDDRPLEDGDIVFLNGFHGDCSSTFLIGSVDDAGRHLVSAAQKCLEGAIAICRPGEYFCNIGNTIECIARKNGVTIIPAFIGHGIGSYFHGPPDIYHTYNDYPGKMEEGMTFTVEPVIGQGSQEVVILEDGWTALTVDNSRSAQFEHTILITNDGVEILTA
ncbi:methionine aminopeptidase 1D, mitochondrial isoform X2 [Ischnura elegans]|uniref:methionine aminopeptidase 1D, mitochondrial isoform X2 n=1 Tax=Ischnura elegans TaxID=197161 RepID=UPI001ED8A42E|nr:methionine aminopeptidase 1D, mitochondrial isoform X2 [Ischnura elegans]